MALPNVKIDFANGQISSGTPLDDGVCGLLCSAVAVSGKFTLDKAYLLTKLSDLTALGIDSTSTGANARVYKTVKEFYDEAPAETKLWIEGVDSEVTIDEIVDKSNTYASTLLNAANGDIKILFVSMTDDSDYTPTITGGMDGKVYTAITNAQALAEEVTTSKYAPIMVVLEARHYSGTASDLTDLTTMSDNRVCVVLGDTVSGSDGAATGLMTGRLASIPVQRSIARVKTGAITADSMYIGSSLAEDEQISTIHDKGFIAPRTFVGMSGYYWCDDLMATKGTDDYQMIQRRRTIDKAYRICYQTLVEELSDELPVNDEGMIASPRVKSIEAKVESAILNDMGVNGNLGNDPTDANDLGVKCYIPDKQNIVSTSTLKVVLYIKPFGYAKYITVELGFSTNTSA